MLHYDAIKFYQKLKLKLEIQLLESVKKIKEKYHKQIKFLKKYKDKK